MAVSDLNTRTDIVATLERLRASMQHLIDLQNELGTLFDQPERPASTAPEDPLDTLLQQIQQANLDLADAEGSRLEWAQQILPPSSTGEQTSMTAAFDAAQQTGMLPPASAEQAGRVWQQIHELSPVLARVIKQNSIILNRLDHYLGEQIDLLFQDRDGTRPVYGASGQARGSDRRRSLGEA